MNAQPASLATQDRPPKCAGAFPTTQWSLVVRAGTESPTTARAALDGLCRRYWYPIYGFVRRQGRTHHEAEDCTQAFFAQLLATAGMQRADPARGRFRTFLLTAVRNFLTAEWRGAHAAKRGGGVGAVSLDLPVDDPRFVLEPADRGLTPEQAFDRRWARELIDRTVRELREDYARDGRAGVFDALAPLVWGHDVAADSLAEHAARSGLSTAGFTVALHRLRRRLGARLRANVAETVADAAEIDAELRHLIDAIRAPGAGA